MKKIVAIGGGGNGRPYYDNIPSPYEIKKIDEEIVRLSGKNNPHVLFLAQAQPLDKQYLNFKVIEKNYGDLWWIYPKNQVMKIIRKEYNTGKYDSYCANGVGGSLISVIPEKNIVICITSSLVYNPKIRSELINNYLLPYIETKETSKVLKK